MTDYLAWRDRLATANDPAFLPITYLDQMLAEGRAQFWGTDEAAIVTGIEQFPGGAIVCRGLAATGDAERMIADLKPAIEAWAKARGCTHTMLEGRDGWRRKHPDYQHHQTILTKEL